MVFFNYALRKLNAKIVYYGPGLCGKTTNLQWIHDHFEGGQRGKMISLATEGDRTIFFDLLPIDIGSIRGMDVTLQLYTVPGQVHYNSTRQLVLRGADGVVFVADSQRTMKSSNVESFENLQENLMLQGIDIKEFPHCLQFNKRDLRDLLSPEELNESLNVFSVPIFEGIATEGIGVQETLEGIVKLVMRNLRQKYEPISGTGPKGPTPMGAGRPTPMQPAAAAPPAPASAAPLPMEPTPPAPEPMPEVPMPPMDPPAPEPAPEATTPPFAAPAVESPPAATPDFESPAPTFDLPESELPEPEESVSDAMQDIDSDGGFATFKDEDKVDTGVYEIKEAEDDDGSEFGMAAGSGGDSVFAVDRAPSEPAPETGDEGELFADSRDEDGTPESVASRFEPPEPATTQEHVDLDTDPEAMAEDLQPRTAGESIDDLFGGDSGAEAVPDEEEPDTVVAPPKEDRFIDRINAPGPFAPASPTSAAAEAAAAKTAETARREVDAQVRQALGASEDREALASLADGQPEGLIEPPVVQPVDPPPMEEPAFEVPADSGEVSGEVFSSEDGIVETPAVADEFVVEEPIVEEPVVEEPVFEEPVAAEPVIEKFAAAEPAIEEFAAAEPAVEEPAVDEPDTAAPVIDEPIFEESDVAAPIVEEPPPVEVPAPVGDPMTRSRPIMVHEGREPFVDEATGVGMVILPELLVGEAAQPSTAIDVTAEDNQLHLQLKGSGAIAEIGQVRALDIEVPVPGQWVGNRKVTLQLRLTLTPAEEEND